MLEKVSGLFDQHAHYCPVEGSFREHTDVCPCNIFSHSKMQNISMYVECIIFLVLNAHIRIG